MNTKVVEIANNTSTITLTSSTGDFVSIQKQDAKLKYTATMVFLYDSKLSGNAPLQVEDDCYLLDYTQITTPSTASNLELAELIDIYLNL